MNAVVEVTPPAPVRTHQSTFDRRLGMMGVSEGDELQRFLAEVCSLSDAGSLAGSSCATPFSYASRPTYTSRSPRSLPEARSVRAAGTAAQRSTLGVAQKSEGTPRDATMRARSWNVRQLHGECSARNGLM